MKTLRSIFIWIITSGICIAISIGLTSLFFSDFKNFPFFGCGVALAFAIIDYSIAKKLNYTLDIMTYNSDDIKFMLLNDILIGCICTFPLVMFISLIL